MAGTRGCGTQGTGRAGARSGPGAAPRTMYPPGGPGRAWDRGGEAARRRHHQSESATSVTYRHATPPASDSTNRRAGGRFVGEGAVCPRAEGRLPPRRSLRGSPGDRPALLSGPLWSQPWHQPVPLCPAFCPRGVRPGPRMSRRMGTLRGDVPCVSLTQHRTPACVAAQGMSAKGG